MEARGQTSGVILPVFVFVMVFITVAALAIANFAINHFTRVTQRIAETNATLTAEAGIEETVAELNDNDTFLGFTTPQEFFDNQEQGRGTYETTVLDTSLDNEKEIVSTAKIYLPHEGTDPVEVHRVKVIVKGEITGRFSVQSGVGGLEMSNSATVANGDVYVNGGISMQNTAEIGTESDPTNVWAAHFTCPDPADSTYPQQCGSDEGEPITIQNRAHIYGEVRATNQTNGDGMSHPGLVSGSSADFRELPGHDRTAQQDAVEVTRSNDDASCSGSESKTWAANTHITGGQVTANNSCTITVAGDVWIDGSLEMNNISQLIVDDSVSTDRPVIMIDGQNGFKIQNNTEIITNSDGTGLNIITYWSDADCSPDCDDVTGVDLANSQGQTTIDINNSTIASDSVFYARWSAVRLQNSGTVGALIGQTVKLQNTGNIVFNAEDVIGDRTWVIKTYQKLPD